MVVRFVESRLEFELTVMTSSGGGRLRVLQGSNEALAMSLRDSF